MIRVCTFLLKKEEYEELSKSIFDLMLKVRQKDKEIENLQNKLQQKENIIKEVRDYIEQCQLGEDNEGNPYMLANQEEGQKLLEILDKENK